MWMYVCMFLKLFLMFFFYLEAEVLNSLGLSYSTRKEISGMWTQKFGTSLSGRLHFLNVTKNASIDHVCMSVPNIITCGQ